MSGLAIEREPDETIADSLRRLILPALVLLMIGGMAAGLLQGAAPLSLSDLGGALWEAVTRAPATDQMAHAILFEIRAPRVALGVMVGATLAVSGAILQALFRNPLAEAGIIGVSAGASAAAVATIVLGGAFAALGPLILYALPVAAFVGALVATLLVMAIARVDGQSSMSTMLLGGIAVSALGGALMGLMMFLSNDEQLRSITFWMLGSLGAATWVTIVPALIMMAVMLGTMPALMRRLNLILLGEREAQSLGLRVDVFKNICVTLVAVGVGAAVAVSGTIGFVGIVVPHLLRFVVGPDHRILLPTVAVGGAALLLWADVVARTLAPPAELPIGVLTALLGAPFFLWLLRRATREGAQW